MDATKYKNYAHEWLKKIRPYLEEEKPATTTHRCCIQLTSNELSLIHIDKHDNQFELLATETFKFDKLESLPLVLSGVNSKYELAHIPTFVVLPFDAYQLFILDAMPVPDNELNQALSWRIKSLINYPITDAVIDYFTIPAKKAAPDNPMIGAVVTQKSWLKQLINIIESSGLALTTIDIPELSLRNLTSLYETDDKSTALIYFTEKFVILNITRHKKLYFSRRIELEADDNNGSRYEKLGLEVLRYFDYFQTQWRFAVPTRILIAYLNPETENQAKSLSDYLLTPVQTFSLKDIFFDEKSKNVIEHQYLIPFGSALRQEEQHVQTRD